VADIADEDSRTLVTAFDYRELVGLLVEGCSRGRMVAWGLGNLRSWDLAAVLVARHHQK
jgi:hypothetical protein